MVVGSHLHSHGTRSTWTLQLSPTSAWLESMIIQDHFGLVITALSKCIPLPLGPLKAKAKALDEATIFAWDIRVKDVIFETDSTAICHAMESPTDALVSISIVVLGLCSRLHEFWTFQASHVVRQGNKPAHTLVVFVKNIDSFVTWMEECPPFLASSVS